MVYLTLNIVEISFIWICSKLKLLHFFVPFRMTFEERNKKKEKKEADVFAEMQRRKSQSQERKALEEKENN